MLTLFALLNYAMYDQNPFVVKLCQLRTQMDTILYCVRPRRRRMPGFLNVWSWKCKWFREGGMEILMRTPFLTLLEYIEQGSLKSVMKKKAKKHMMT